MEITDELNTTPSGVSNRFNELTSEEFIKIMFTELTRQDPTEPQDTSKLMEQISSLRTIESDLQLTEQIQELVGQNQFAAASNLIGKEVYGLTDDLLPAIGRVVGAGIEDDRVILTLESGERVPFENVESVYELDDSEGE